MTPTAEQKLIEELKSHIEEMQQFIEQVKEGSSPYATVAFVGDTRILLAAQAGAYMEVGRPVDMTLVVGETVKIQQQTGQIVDKGIVQTRGEVLSVKEVTSAFSAHVEGQGSRVLTVFKDGGLSLHPGDRVQLDLTGMVILYKVHNDAEKYVKTGTGVTWEDIGGLEDVKQLLRDAIELPAQQPEMFAFYGYKPPKGVLLAGGPGNGKTMLGKAAATTVAKMYGGESGFIYVKGPEILNMYVGNSEKGVRDIFEQAREHKEKYGAPAIVFIDEAEAILSRRGTGISGDMEKTIVPMFLAEMDGIDESSAIVILATNRPDQLDPAVVRPGRIDRRVEVPAPGPDAVRSIAFINLKKAPVCEATTEDLADLVAQELMSPERRLYDLHLDTGVRAFTLADLVSGAMVTNVVDQAKGIAMNRDLKAKTRTGVRKDDILSAIQLVSDEATRADVSDAVAAATAGHTLRGITRANVLQAVA